MPLVKETQEKEEESGEELVRKRWSFRRVDGR
jgi:hypothetical protein